MNQAAIDSWTDSEQAIAQAAFETAYNRAVAKLVASVQLKASELNEVNSVWELHDFLSIQRHTIEGRFDFRLEGILFVFASLVKDDLLQLQELEGLTADKLAKVSAMSRF